MVRVVRGGVSVSGEGVMVVVRVVVRGVRVVVSGGESGG